MLIFALIAVSDFATEMERACSESDIESGILFELDSLFPLHGCQI